MSYDDRYEDDAEYLTEEEIVEAIREEALELLNEENAALDVEDQAFWDEIEAVGQRVGHPLLNSDLKRIEKWYADNPDTDADLHHAFNQSKPDLSDENIRTEHLAEIIEDGASEEAGEEPEPGGGGVWAEAEGGEQ